MTVFAAALLLACELVAAPAKGAPNQETRAHSGSLPLSRLEVIRRAADQNPQVAAARSDILRAQAQAGRVEAARHPEITGLEIFFGQFRYVSTAGADGASSMVH